MNSINNKLLSLRHKALFQVNFLITLVFKYIYFRESTFKAFLHFVC